MVPKHKEKGHTRARAGEGGVPKMEVAINPIDPRSEMIGLPQRRVICVDVQYFNVQRSTFNSRCSFSQVCGLLRIRGLRSGACYHIPDSSQHGYSKKTMPPPTCCLGVAFSFKETLNFAKHFDIPTDEMCDRNYLIARRSTAIKYCDEGGGLEEIGGMSLEVTVARKFAWNTRIIIDIRYQTIDV